MTEKNNAQSDGNGKKPSRAVLVLKFLISGLFIATFCLYQVKIMKVDQTGIILLVLAMIPWLGMFLDGAEVFGIKFQFRKIREKQVEIESAHEQIRKQQDAINKSFNWLKELTGLMISNVQQIHLTSLAQGDFDARFYKDSPFEDELRHLIAIGMIERKHNRGFTSISNEANSNGDHRVRIENHLQITGQGRRYLQLQKETMGS